MTRNLLIVGTVAVFGLAAALAGAGDAGTAVACDDAAKSAAVSSSCCPKGDAKSVSADAKRIRGGSMSSKECATTTTAAAGQCASSAVHASVASAPASCTAVKTASMAAGCDKSAATTAAVAHDGCEKGAAAKTASASGCEKDAAAAGAGGDACCKGTKTAAAAGSKEACESQAKSASLKGVVDELPYRESKRVVLAGAYACGNCTLHKTEACSPMVKTADGKVYPLLQNSHTADIKRTKGSNIEVTGVVKKVDGVKYIDVKTYKVI